MNTSIRTSYLLDSPGKSDTKLVYASDTLASTSMCLKVAVSAALTCALSAISMRLFPSILAFDPIFFLATLVGLVCSPISLIKERGFSRLVAALTVAVSICALGGCISFFGWVSHLP
jgi:hypothetical protein